MMMISRHQNIGVWEKYALGGNRHSAMPSLLGMASKVSPFSPVIVYASR